MGNDPSTLLSSNLGAVRLSCVLLLTIPFLILGEKKKDHSFNSLGSLLPPIS